MSAEHHDGRRFVVLCVEDNAANAALITSILRMRPKVELVVAATAREGLETATTRRLDLVLLDLQLPDAPGTDVLEGLRGDALNHDVPVLVLTADARIEQRERLIEAGVQAFMPKPIVIAEFLAEVDRLLPADP